MTDPLIIRVPVTVTHKNDQPAIKLRRHTTDLDLIKIIVSAAFHKKQLIIQPEFTNELFSINSLIEKGILYKDGNMYRFTF